MWVGAALRFAVCLGALLSDMGFSNCVLFIRVRQGRLVLGRFPSRECARNLPGLCRFASEDFDLCMAVHSFLLRLSMHLDRRVHEFGRGPGACFGALLSQMGLSNCCLELGHNALGLLFRGPFSFVFVRPDLPEDPQRLCMGEIGPLKSGRPASGWAGAVWRLNGSLARKPEGALPLTASLLGIVCEFCFLLLRRTCGVTYPAQIATATAAARASFFGSPS